MKQFAFPFTAAMMPDMKALAAVILAFLLTELTFLFISLHGPALPASSAILRPHSTTAPLTQIHSASVPQHLVIPSIHVNAPVEDVGLLSDGTMDAPKGWNDVGWYELGPRPGENGNAVIAGHLDSYTGPAVFWHLKDLKKGDTLSVVDGSGATHTFVVAKTAEYATDNPPMNRIFGSATGAHLNLITCGGSWDESMHRYNARMVVYADAVNK